LLGLPAREEPTTEQPSGAPSEKPTDDPAADPDAPAARARLRASAADLADDAGLHPAARSLPLGAMAAELDRTETELSGALRSLIGRQIDRVRDQLARPIRAAARGGDAARSGLFEQLDRLELPFEDEYQGLLLRYLEEASQSAAEASAAVMGRRVPTAALRRLRPTLLHQATAVAQHHAGNLVFALRTQIAQDLEAKQPAETILWNLEQAARERRSLDFSGSLSQACDTIGRALAAALPDAV